MTGKDVSFVIHQQIKSCSNFVCEWGLFMGISGTTRVRKGMPGSLPSGLLTPTVPWCKIYNEHSQGITYNGD